MDIYERSYEILEEIVAEQKNRGFSVALIGGWATYLYNPYMKSRDIDVRADELWKLKDLLIQAQKANLPGKL